MQRLPQPFPSEVFRTVTSSGKAVVFQRYDDLSEEIWASFFGREWKNHHYLRLVEATLPDDFAYFHIALLDESENVLALQPGFTTVQDLALGFPPVLRRGVEFIRRIFPNFLNPPMAFLGSPAANGKITANTRNAPAVAEAFLAYARHRRISLLTFKEFPAADRLAFAAIRHLGFTPLASYPGVAMDLDFPDFETYCATKLGKSTRRSLRQKFANLENHPLLRMESVADISPYLARIHALYLDVYERAEEKFEKLTPAFFAAVAEELPDRARFFLWWQGEKLVAFSLCFVHEGIFYDDYLGMDESIARELHLYYVTFRDQINWALSQSLQTYYSTPMSYEPKLRLGFRLVPLDLYVRHTSPWMNRIYGPLAKALAPTLHDAVLQRFANFSTLDPESGVV